MKYLKSFLFLFIILFISYNSAIGEITRDVDEFDNDVVLTSQILIHRNYNNFNDIAAISLYKYIIDGEETSYICISYLSDHLYLYSFSSDLEFKFNGDVFMGAEYITQDFDCTSYFPLHYILSSLYLMSYEMKELILSTSDTIECRVTFNDIGTKIFTIDSSTIDEWKIVLNTPLYPDCIDSQEYSSTFEKISWGCRDSDEFYSLDIFDTDGKTVLIPAIKSGNHLHEYSPMNEGINLPAGLYKWKVWSPIAEYSGDGFSGTFEIPEDYQENNNYSYRSDYELVQWVNRGGDTFYCIDIFDCDWNMLYQAVSCGEEVHNYSPQELNLPAGTYRWKVWSPNGYGGDGFEGEFTVSGDCEGLDYLSTYTSIQWGCRNNDTFYCIDIFDADWNMLHQAISCGEGVHSYSPEELNLSTGTYNWKVWSSSGYGGDGFEGDFVVQDR